MDNLELILLYEHVSALTGRMLQAARAGDWELLSRLETDCTSRVQRIRENEAPAELSSELRERKIRIIKKILADDKEIRDITEPWMQQLANLMKNSGTARKLSRTYGAGGAA